MSSLAALAVPVWITATGGLQEASGLDLIAWLPTLVPAFLLAYHRGWTGAALGLAGGMATLAAVQVEVLALDVAPPPWGFVFASVVAWTAVALGVGSVSELLLRSREEAEATALSDALTGLPNRRHASVFLDAAWGRSVRGGRLALILFDLDGFKTVNDRYGHGEGDRVLRVFAGILRERTRRMDLCARFGGEEFVTILVDCDEAAAAAYAEDVRRRFAEADFGWGSVTVSAGVGAAAEGMISPDILFAAVDRALYQAKAGGRNRVVPVGQVRQDPAPRRLSPSAPGPHDASTDRLPGTRLLLVDDEDGALRVGRRLAERLGCRVTTASTGREALRILAGEGRVDVLVTDVVMSEMSGFTLVDLASKLRPDLPALYLSGYPQDEAHWGGTPGARTAFLAKPVDLDGLRRTLLALLSPAAVNGRVPMEPAEADGRTDRLPGRILVVDDDPSIVATLQRLFTRAGYAPPLGVTDGGRVKDVVEAEDVDLIVLDLNMPGVSGFDVLADLAERHRADEYLPVLVLTGQDDPRARRRALAAGAKDFLGKPFDAAEAEARVRNLLATRSLTQRVAGQRDTLEARVHERTAELADTRSEVLRRLARAAEYRDDVTGRHAERVGLLSCHLAAELGLAAPVADDLRRSAPLHDVGKIGVPDAILRKPAPLSRAEFEIMKTHTLIGAQILGGSRHQILRTASDIALGHHERWDGRGYPHGHAGDAIPLAARIVAVTDSFDTITHQRPYKEARSARRALQEIRRCRGTHFDPDVVDAFEAICEREGADHIHDLADPLHPGADL